MRKLALVLALGGLLLAQIACGGIVGDYPETRTGATYTCPEGQRVGLLDTGQMICYMK